jgi:MFS family permease
MRRNRLRGEPGPMRNHQRTGRQPALRPGHVAGDGPAAMPRGAAVVLVGIMLAIYAVSQFLRNSVGVIAPDIAAEIGLSAAEIGLLSSAFFLVFAAAQLPLGVALDRFGPRRCLLVCAAITVAGTILFAVATTPLGLIAGRTLLGLGCASSLMAPLALYAKRFPPDRFATLTGLQLGLGSIGTLLATAPLAWAAATVGWRASFLAVGVFTLAVGLLIAVAVQDPGASARRESLRENLAGILAVIRTPSVGALFLMNLASYSTFALVVGLWGGPYLAHIYGYDLPQRGTVLLLAAVTQIIGALLWGPMDRLLGRYKLPVLLGAGLTGAALAGLAWAGTLSPTALIVWFAAFGLVSAYVPVMIAHGKALFPPHLVGRGLTLLNMGTMVGVFVTQLLSGAVIDLFPSQGGVYPLAAYRLVFALQAAFLLAAALFYLRCRDPRAPG